MAHIKITALDHDEGGPDMPTPITAMIGEKVWPGGGTVPVLNIYFNNRDSIEVWPADPDYIEELGKKMIAIAAELRARMRK